MHSDSQDSNQDNPNFRNPKLVLSAPGSQDYCDNQYRRFAVIVDYYGHELPTPVELDKAFSSAQAKAVADYCDMYASRENA